MLRKHVSDELLMAHLDGELSRAAARNVEKHLLFCWQCRALHAKLEALAERVSDAYLGAATFNSPQTHKARLNFHTWASRVEEPGIFAGYVAPASSIWTQWRLALLAGAVLCLTVVGYFGYRKPAGPQAEQIAALAGRHESQWAAYSVHQVFYAEVSETQPARHRVGGALEIWSDGANQRYASRWKLDDGDLRFARWQPDSGRRLRWDARAAGIERVANVRTPPVSLYALDPANTDIDVLFLRWLDNRSGEPLLLARELLQFAARNSATLTVERVRTGEGQGVFRITGTSRNAGLNVELMANVRAEDYVTKSLRVRFENAGRTVEISLTVKSNDRVPAVRISAGVFEPDLKPAALRNLPAAISHSGSVAPTMAPTPAPVDAAVLNELQVEVYYALHRLGICGGDVEVSRVGDRIVVSGVVDSEDRKERILAGLSRLPPATALSVDLKAPSDLSTEPGAATAGKGGEVQLVGHGPVRLKAEIELEAYRRPGASAAPSGAELTSMANQALNLDGLLMDDAWALRRLGTQFTKEVRPSFSPHAQNLLTVIAREHAVSLRRSLSHISQLLSSVFSLLPGESVSAGSAAGAAGWTGQCEHLYKAAQRLHDGTEALFAGGGMSVEKDRAPIIADRPDKDITLRDYPALLSALDADAARLVELLDGYHNSLSR
jgi:hypothetical protein